MAAPDTISVTTDLAEYSKWEPTRQTITVSITVTGGGDMSGEVVTVELIKARRTRDAVIFQKSVTVSGTDDPESVTTTINLLDDPVDSNYINLAHRGMYFVRVTSVTDPSVIADSSDFKISIITAEELRKSYLFGLELYANDVRQVKYQPVQITGVEVLSLSPNHQMSFAPLTYTYITGSPVIRLLSWGGGGLVNITAPGQYLLRFDSTGSDYMIVRIRSLSALPTSSKTEEMLVDKDKISDSQISRWIDQACDWWETDKICVFLEPTRVTTDPVQNGTLVDYDYIVPPVTYYPTTSNQWISILFPYPGLIRVDRLSGQIATVQVIDVDRNWIEVSERNGFAQLVPLNHMSAFRFTGLLLAGSMGQSAELPNFWHFNLVAGLRQTDPVALEVVAKKAAIDVLTVAGHAYRGGFSSQSISRDGVSESVSYTASAIYGIFSATIEDYSKFINREIKGIRGKYRGMNLLVT